MRRSVRQRRTPSTYVPSHENRRYVDVPGVVNLNLQYRRYDIKGWLREAYGISLLNVDKWMNSTRLQQVQWTINLNVEPPDRGNLMPSDEDIMAHVLGVAIVQTFSLKKGLKKFGDKGKSAVQSELQQMQDMAVYTPMDPKDLTPEQRREALAWFMFLVEKRDGRIKARGVADGSKQKQKPGYKKDDASSPTVSNEGVMITCATEAHEKSDVACIGIPGALLNAMMDEEIIMLLRGPLAEMMVVMNPQLYRKYVTQDSKGESVLYVIEQDSVRPVTKCASIL